MKHKILVVDDKKVALIILETILNQLPYVEVVKANNGKEAFLLAQKNDFSLALIDIIMPDMSGIELANLLYNHDKTVQLPIIFLSAEYPDKSQLSQYDDAILVDFMLKPVNKDLLQHKVKTLLRLDLRAKDLNRLVKEKTTALNDALDNWHGTLDAISDYIVIVDTNHTIKTANLAMLKKFGDNIIGKKCYEIFHTNKYQSPICPIFNLAGDNKSSYHSIINDQSGNKELFWDMSVFPIKEKNGKISRYVHVARDVTAARTMDKQLRHGEKMIAIGQLAGGIAHDFNNQLTAILGYATLLRNKVEDDPLLCNFVDIIITASKRSTDLTRQLLAFARKGIYKKEDNDIHVLIKEAIVLIDRTIDKSIKLKLELHAENSVIQCDATQMENAILNLIINARDAIKKNGCITISTENVCINSLLKRKYPNIASGYYIKLIVEDTGAGMSDEIMDHIFEPFFSTKEEKGTGLGLAAIYGTVIEHKGDIRVESELGKGSKFTILLPVLNSGDNIGEDTEFAIEDAKDANTTSATIMLVDDEKMVRDYTEEVISALGHNPISCSNGKDAIEIYKKRWQDIDLVLLDIIMPEMGGEETYEMIRTINPNVKVIFVSGYTDSNIQEFLKSDATQMITKPFDIKTISEILKKILSKKSE